MSYGHAANLLAVAPGTRAQRLRDERWQAWRLEALARLESFAGRDGWYPATHRDGGAHLGRLEGQTVTARCGLRFTPLPGVCGVFPVWAHPVEPEHACADCAAVL